MPVVLLTASVLMLQILESSMAPSPPQTLRPELDLRSIRPLAFQVVQKHLLSLTRAQDSRPTARLLQAPTLPHWFPDRDSCFIEYCNHYEVLRKSLCCSATAKKEYRADGGLYCAEATTCDVADGEQVRRCRSSAVQEVDRIKRHIFSPSCGGVSEANSTVHHNGTHFVREVHATWKCAFPDGTCFSNHAPLEGLPEKLQDCVTEENEGPLTVRFTIDLHCAHMDQKIHCDSNLYTQSFDPFTTCTNDPDLLKAQCQIRCTNGYAKEFCKFEFDPIGRFNMSDRTIDACSLHAECMSPYIEANSLFCSSHQGQSHFKPHWESRPLPNRNAPDHGLRGPPLPTVKTELSSGTVISLVLWAATLIPFGAGALLLALRIGILPEAWQEQIESVFDYFQGHGSVRARSFGTPYRAPPVRHQRSQYVAPAPAASHADHGTDQELEKIVDDRG